MCCYDDSLLSIWVERRDDVLSLHDFAVIQASLESRDEHGVSIAVERRHEPFGALLMCHRARYTRAEITLFLNEIICRITVESRYHNGFLLCFLHGLRIAVTTIATRHHCHRHC